MCRYNVSLLYNIIQKQRYFNKEIEYGIYPLGAALLYIATKSLMFQFSCSFPFDRGEKRKEGETSDTLEYSRGYD